MDIMTAIRDQQKLMAVPISNKEVRRRVYDRFGGCCVYCCRETPYSPRYVENDPGMRIDHVWPLSRGGQDIESNYVLSCMPCNGSKGAKILWSEWIPPRARMHAGNDGPLAADMKARTALVAQSEKKATEWRSYAWKLEEETIKLRSALLSLARCK